MNGNATRYVILAMSFTALLFIIAGDSWNARIQKYAVPVSVAK